MKVFFTASYWGKKQYQKYYDKIIEVLKANDVEVIGLECGKHSDLLKPSQMKNLTKDELHYLYTKKGIDKAKAVIIESSTDSFRLGHEATLSLLLHKPVLCLAHDTDYSKLIKHPKFFAKQYKDEADLEKYISTFIKELKEKHLAVRFHGFLTPEQKNFLEWYGQKHGMNSSEVVRQLIDSKMSETTEYKGLNKLF